MLCDTAEVLTVYHAVVFAFVLSLYGILKCVNIHLNTNVAYFEVLLFKCVGGSTVL